MSTPEFLRMQALEAISDCLEYLSFCKEELEKADILTSECLENIKAAHADVVWAETCLRKAKEVQK